MKTYLLNPKYLVLAAILVYAVSVFAGHPLAPPEGLLALGALPMMIGDTTNVGPAEIKALIEKQGTAWEEYKKTNDELVKAKADGKSVTDLEVKLTRISGELDKVGELKDAVTELQKKANRPDLPASEKDRDIDAEVKAFNVQRKAFDVSSAGTPITADEYKAYHSGFFNLMRKGNVELLSDAERKAMIAGDDSNGGYLLPPTTVGRAVARIFELSPIRAIAGVQPISTDAMEGIYDNDEASYGWVGEVAARTDTNTPTLGKYRVEAHEMYAAPKASQKLIDDSAVDIENWLAMKVADKFARAEGDKFINGTGVAQPRGFATYTTAATGDATRTWGELEHVKTGANGAFHTTQADPLFDLLGAFKPGYLGNAKWVTLRSVITAIRKFKTTTTLEYIWQPGLQVGQPDRLLGYPIVIAQDMPALATDSLSMAFGDFKEGYQIVDRVGIRTLRDPYTSKPYVIFYSTKRVGGAVLNFEAIKFIKFSA